MNGNIGLGSKDLLFVVRVYVLERRGGDDSCRGSRGVGWRFGLVCRSRRGRHGRKGGRRHVGQRLGFRLVERVLDEVLAGGWNGVGVCEDAKLLLPILVSGEGRREREDREASAKFETEVKIENRKAGNAIPFSSLTNRLSAELAGVVERSIVIAA